MAERQARLEEARQRALIITRHIRERADEGVRQTIKDFEPSLDFEGRLPGRLGVRRTWQLLPKHGPTSFKRSLTPDWSLPTRTCCMSIHRLPFTTGEFPLCPSSEFR